MNREKGLFLSVYVDVIKLAGKKQNLDPMWKLLNKEVDFWRTNIFLGSCILGLHSTTMRNKQRYCGQLQNQCLNRQFPREELKSFHTLRIFVFLRGLMIWKVMQRNVRSDIVSWQTRRLNNSTKYLLTCIDDHHFKEEEMKSVGELSQVCSQIVLKCLHLARVGRPDILPKWTEACDKRLNRLISYIHHTCEYKQYCYVGNTAKQCRLGLFQDSEFADLEDSKSTFGGTLCILGSHTFVPISWMCKKQTSVSDSSTESEIISLDAGLRLDGILTLDLWDLIVSVLGNTIQTLERPGRPVVKDKDQKYQGMINVLNNVDCVPSNVQFSHQEALLYVFEDNEAVIKMIIRRRSSTMRHVSSTHRVALDWLFDRINLDPIIQIKCIDTKNQLADMLTKGNFTRDEWNHLLCLFNIGHFSSAVCSEAMEKDYNKIQEKSESQRNRDQ